MKVIGSIIVDGEKVSILQDEYLSGGIALELTGAEGPYAVFTDCVPGSALGAGEFVARTCAENEALRQPMLDTGLFIDTGRRIGSDVAKNEVWKMTA